MSNSAAVTFHLQAAGSVDFVIVGSGLPDCIGYQLARHGRVVVLQQAGSDCRQYLVCPGWNYRRHLS